MTNIMIKTYPLELRILDRMIAACLNDRGNLCISDNSKFISFMTSIYAVAYSVTTQIPGRIKAAFYNDRGDFYISDGVKVIIAVVLGALLLGALTLIFNGTIIPKITDVIDKLFT